MTPNTPTAGTNDGKPSAVTKEQCVAWLDNKIRSYMLRLQIVNENSPRAVELSQNLDAAEATLSHLRSPAPVLGEAERSALMRIAHSIEAYDDRMKDHDRDLAVRDAEWLRSLASRLTTAQGGEDG